MYAMMKHKKSDPIARKKIPPQKKRSKSKPPKIGVHVQTDAVNHPSGRVWSSVALFWGFNSGAFDLGAHYQDILHVFEWIKNKENKKGEDPNKMNSQSSIIGLTNCFKSIQTKHGWHFLP